MGIKQRIEQDLKSAMLAGDKKLVSTLRVVKSAILYVEVAKDARETGLPDPEIVTILSKESKKRQESADLYTHGGSHDRAASEIEEKAIIDKYLPQQLELSEIQVLVDKAISELGATDKKLMGQVISLVKERSLGSADSALIAKLVKEKLG